MMAPLIYFHIHCYLHIYYEHRKEIMLHKSYFRNYKILYLLTFSNKVIVTIIGNIFFFNLTMENLNVVLESIRELESFIYKYEP